MIRYFEVDRSIPDLKSEAIDFRAASELVAPYMQMTALQVDELKRLNWMNSFDEHGGQAWTSAHRHGSTQAVRCQYGRTASFRHNRFILPAVEWAETCR